MIDTALRYGMIARDMSKTLALTKSDPMVTRESAYYLEHIREIKNVDDFIKNDRIFNYAMKAMGLEDMAYAKGFMKKALKEGIADKDSFANKLSDPRYKEFVKVFNFAEYGETATNFTSSQTAIVDKYVEMTLEINEGNENEGVRLALYFKRKSTGIKSPYELLADPALYKVIRTAIGMPDQMVGTDVDKQANYIKNKLDMKVFKNPNEVDKLINKFTALYDVLNNINTSPTLQLFTGNAFAGVNPNTLASFNAIKFGG
ncbi:DUF1217 domain-containing protein [Polycladidibacter stylochi]|uniref:DUF1217 domain-containing protein n=1 Tax=Polycladidibacter stylochi TaxID=1807766 RepID=UPI00083545A7|nr:DUF1217 domain-containing protein [Pseudovibrio stylochi]